MKKVFVIALVIIALITGVLVFVSLTEEQAPDDSSAQTPSRPKKKWHPGHYIYHKDGDVDPQRIKDYYKDPRYDATAGVYVQAYWKSLEPQKDQYNMQFIRQYLDALPEDKSLVIVFMDRDYNVANCQSSKIPAWVPRVQGSGAEKGCVSKFWEKEVIDQEIELLTKIAQEFDNHPQFEGIALQETSFGASEFGLTHQKVLKTYEEIHERSKDLFVYSHLFRKMNSLGGPEQSCINLGILRDQLKGYGYGIGNPDSVPWHALPWDCVGERPNSVTKPIYGIYRQKDSSMFKFVGNDGSQLGDPANPQLWNGERMTIPNLVKYHYLTAVQGYVHKDYGQIESFGATHLGWLSDFWSQGSSSAQGSGSLSPAMKKEWVDEVLKFINQPGHETNQACPSNIECVGFTPIPSKPGSPSATPSITPGKATNTPTPGASVTPTPPVSGRPPSSSTPTATSPQGNICGKGDIDGNGIFTIADFTGFAQAYGNGKNTCADKEVNYGACGGRDVNRDGSLNIFDFGAPGVGFAQRYYPKTSCAL